MQYFQFQFSNYLPKACLQKLSINFVLILKLQICSFSLSTSETFIDDVNADDDEDMTTDLHPSDGNIFTDYRI